MKNTTTTETRRYGLVVPVAGTSMWKWAARNGHDDTHWADGTTAWWPSIEEAKVAAAVAYPGRRDVYAAEIPESNYADEPMALSDLLNWVAARMAVRR